MRNLKETLNHGPVLKNMHRAIKFNQEAWLKPYIDMNTELTKNAKTYFEKKNKLMSNGFFGKATENVRKQRYQACNNTRRKELFSVRTKQSYNQAFFWKSNSNANEKTQIFMNKSNVRVLVWNQIMDKKPNYVTWIQTAL